MKTPTRLAAAVCALVVALTAACTAPAAPTPPAGWQQAYITRDGADTTDVAATGPQALRVTAPSANSGGNSRTLLWRPSSPASVNHDACVTTTQSGWPVQEGVALRVAPSPLGDHRGTRAITVQKNIWGRADHVYNVHLWDTTPGAAEGGITSFTRIAGFDMTAAVAGTRPADGRRICARLNGRTLDYKVWPAHQSEPAWGDPVHTRSVTVPADWVHPGRPGLYIGHVPPGGWANLTHHTAPTPPTPTTSTTNSSTTTTVAVSGTEVRIDGARIGPPR